MPFPGLEELQSEIPVWQKKQHHLMGRNLIESRCLTQLLNYANRDPKRFDF